MARKEKKKGFSDLPPKYNFSLNPYPDMRFTSCPQCGAPQKVHFDMQRYLLHTLNDERGFLHREVHIIATTYGWSRAEILDLPREDRRVYVRLIIADREAAQDQRRVPLS